jgi:hypothetical protein
MVQTTWRWAGASLLGAAAVLGGCAHPAPAPEAKTELMLLPVPDGGWQTFDAVLAGTFSDPAASYDGVYGAKKKATKFRIEVRVPQYAAENTVGPALVAPRPGQPPAKSSYVVVDVYAGSQRLKVAPERIVPLSPCGPPGTPASSVAVGVHPDADGMRDSKLPPGSPYHVGYSRIYVSFDAPPGQLATCALDFTAAIGDGKVTIPPLRLVGEPKQQYSASAGGVPGAE